MKIDRIDHANLTSTIKLTIKNEDYSEAYEKAIKETKQKVNIPGFRKGMVPKGLIKKMHGKAILEEKVWEIASNSLFKYISDNKIHILGEPVESSSEQNVLNYDIEGDFIINFDIGYINNLEIDIANIELLKYKIEVSDKTVDDEIDNIAKQFSNPVEIEEINLNSTVKVNSYELDENGNKLKDGISADNTNIFVSVIKDQEIKDNIVGLKKGDEFTLNIKKAFPNTTEISSILSIDKEIAEKVDSNFHMTIESISEYVPAEKNKELFDKAIPNKSIETLEDFHAEIKKQLEISYEQQANSQFHLDAKNSLMKTEIEFPVEFLKAWMLRKDKTQTIESIDKNWDEIIKEWKWQLIKNHLNEKFEIKVSKEEIEQSIKTQVFQYFIQQNYFPKENELEEMIEKMMNEKETYDKYEDMLVEGKIMVSIREKAIIKEENISYEDFVELNKKSLEEQNAETVSDETIEDDTITEAEEITGE